MTLERGPPLSQARHRRADSSCGEEVQANFSARGHQTNMAVPLQPGQAPRLHTLRAWQGGTCLQYQPKSPGHLGGAPVTTHSHCSKGRGQPRTSVWLATKAVSPSRLLHDVAPHTGHTPGLAQLLARAAPSLGRGEVLTGMRGKPRPAGNPQLPGSGFGFAFSLS